MKIVFILGQKITNGTIIDKSENWLLVSAMGENIRIAHKDLEYWNLYP